MDKEKLRIIRSSADGYKKLPKDKKMFVLGFMQGILCNCDEKKRTQKV